MGTLSEQQRQGATLRLFPKREPEKKSEKRTTFTPSLSDAQERLLSSTLREEEHYAYSQELCDLLFDIERTKILPGIDPELVEPNQIELIAPKESLEPSAKGGTQNTFLRWRIVYAETTLSVRATSGMIEIFLLPASQSPVLAFEENSLRLLKRLLLRATEPEPQWYCLNELMTPESLERLLNGCTRKLIAAASGWGTAKAAARSHVGESSATRGFGSSIQRNSAPSADSHLQRSENMIFSETSEKEALLASIARDIHDNVIADLLMLRRYVTGKKVSSDETVEIVDEIVAKLREICAEHSPKHIQEWGLAPCVEDLVVRISDRTGVSCELDVAENLPDLASAVNLHVFRIVQECLNNIEKYARATRISVKIDYDQEAERLMVSVSDNGVGFDLKSVGRATTGGGAGIAGMHDRATLLHVFHPTVFRIESAPGRGTAVFLEVSLGLS